MKGIFILVVACMVTSGAALVIKEPEYPQKEGWHWIPNEKGVMELFSDKEIELLERFMPRSEVVVKFTLFTRNNRNDGQTLVPNDASSIASSYFDKNSPTRITVHGWRSGPSSSVNTVLTKNYLNKGNYNMIVVDWSDTASSINYIYVRDQVGPVASKVAEFVDFLHTYTDFSFEDLYMIGHSLGAHVVGLAAKEIKTGRVGTIVGLDPALPLFFPDEPENRLSSTDADNVEVIHSNAGIFGYDIEIGDVDFYPNFGRKQPGCSVDPFNSCSHGRAVDYFAESIVQDDAFPGVMCGSYDEIKNKTCVPPNSQVIENLGGEPVRKKTSGAFYLETADTNPYGLGEPPKLSKSS